jgi:hypothetical protein
VGAQVGGQVRNQHVSRAAIPMEPLPHMIYLAAPCVVPAVI